MTKIFFDTEFTGLHQHTTLISIALVSECGKTFYAELNDYDSSQIDEWIQKRVINNLTMSPPKEGEDEYYMAERHPDNKEGGDLYSSYSVKLRCNSETLRKELIKWLYQFRRVEMWSDCLSYDWVLFCQIFGHALSIPKHVYYIPFDICTLFYVKGIDPDINREEYAEKGHESPTSEVQENKKNKHNALHDALIIRECYNRLQAHTNERARPESDYRY